MLITPAYAQTGGGAGDFSFFIPLILMFVIMYFLIIRPQQQRVKKHREMVENVRRGDSVVTGGGIMGKVTKVNEQDVEVEIAQGVRIKVLKASLSEVQTKGEPVKSDEKKK